MSNNYTQKNPSEKELELGILKLRDSWHNDFKNQLYIFITGVDERITELDILKIFSQYGNILDLFFIYDYKRKVRKNSCVLKYSSFESCVLAVDNLNNYKILDKWLKVSHAKGKHPESQEFRTYHEIVKQKLDEAIIYESDSTDLYSQKSPEIKTISKEKPFKVSEDPMAFVNSELLDLE